MDIFKKLTTGAKFDFKRFSNDAERLKLKAAPKDIEPANPVSVECTEEIQTRKRRASESDSCSSDEEIDVLSNVKMSAVSKAKKKKQKKAELKMNLQIEEVNRTKNRNHIHTRGDDMPDPLNDFSQLTTRYSLHSQLVQNVTSCGYSEPTAVQMQAIPCMLERREVLVCAPTGSGKTAAFVIPVLHHLHQPSKAGIRAVILAPTRELAQQTMREVEKLGAGRGLRAYYMQNANKEYQKGTKKLNSKFDILVTTPNRLVWLLEQDPPGIDLTKVEWLVIDESDKLFEEGKTGFRDQLAKIYKACSNADVRRAMFSATFTEEVQNWCRLNLDSLAQVFIGARNTATRTIDQQLVYVGTESGKILQLREIFRTGFTPPVLVFVQSKDRAKELFSELIYHGYNVDAIHADRTQLQRDNAVRSFREGKLWVLICTELMARGIDFKGISLVINFDFPTSAISYIHRIGRTGRAGRSGRAVTLFTDSDIVNLRNIANVMRQSGCDVPEYMLQIKKASKKERKQLEQRAPKRETIRTVSKYDLEKAAKRRARKEQLAKKGKQSRKQLKGKKHRTKKDEPALNT